MSKVQSYDVKTQSAKNTKNRSAPTHHRLGFWNVAATLRLDNPEVKVP